jgi:hypothetical protein
MTWCHAQVRAATCICAYDEKYIIQKTLACSYVLNDHCVLRVLVAGDQKQSLHTAGSCVAHWLLQLQPASQ